MQSFHSGSDVEASNANASFADKNLTWLHLVVSIHAVLTLSLCVFTVLGYVASTVPMALVVLFIFQTFIAIVGLAAIEQNRQDYRSLYITVNAVTTGSAIIWSIYLFTKKKEYPIYVPIVFLIIALFSLIATILLVFFAQRKIPKIFEKVICLNLFPFVKLLHDSNRMPKMEGKSMQMIRTKEVNSNESLNDQTRSIESRQDSSELKTGTTVTERVQQQQRQNISETRSDKYGKESRTAAGAEENAVKVTMEIDQLEKTCAERKSGATLSYVRHSSEGRCLVIGSNWREFYSVPILNACNVALCSTGRIGRNRLRRRLLIKKCRYKKKIHRIIPKFSPLEKNIFEQCPQNNATKI
ncbi:putative integral membrane protein [Acanthocheilonema viteae]